MIATNADGIRQLGGREQHGDEHGAALGDEWRSTGSGTPS